MSHSSRRSHDLDSPSSDSYSDLDSDSDDSASAESRPQTQPAATTLQASTSSLSIFLGSILILLASAAIYFAFIQGDSDDSTLAPALGVSSSPSLVTVTNFRSFPSDSESTVSETRKGTEATATQSRDTTIPVKPTQADATDRGLNPSSAKAHSSTSSLPSSSGASDAEPPKASDSSTHRKKGAGYNDVAYTLPLTSLGWVYSWNSVPGGQLAAGVEYIPMLWGQKQLDGWDKNARSAIEAGATALLGFNEPDLSEQAAMSPADAAKLWKSAIDPLASEFPDVAVVSPAVTNGVGYSGKVNGVGTAMGVDWLLAFVDECKNCRIDAFALHWYESTENTDYFKSYFLNASQVLQKPIWVTEFMGTTDSSTTRDSKQAKFLSSVVPWLESQDFIARYAAFGDFCDNPVANFVKCGADSADKDRWLTESGKAYNDA